MSPITLDMVAYGTVNLVRIVLDVPDTYWPEIRPVKDGRTVIVKRCVSRTNRLSIPLDAPMARRHRRHSLPPTSFP